jgi:hypothetical protein
MIEVQMVPTVDPTTHRAYTVGEPDRRPPIHHVADLVLRAEPSLERELADLGIVRLCRDPDEPARWWFLDTRPEAR